MTEADHPSGPSGRRELFAVVLLSMSAVLTAWSGFQASKWGGEMSIAFAQASSARIEAARQESVANRKLSVQASLFTQWLQAHQSGDEELTSFLRARFPEPLKTSFDTWLADRPLQNAAAPQTPFETAEYVIPETERAHSSDQRANKRFSDALRYNQTGDNYTLLTVAYAAVLFFTALSDRLRNRRSQMFLLVLAATLFVGATLFLVWFPKIV